MYEFHFQNETLATLTAVRPPARFGSLDINSKSYVENFGEKNHAKEGWINGGFFIINRNIKNYIEGDSTLLEQGPLQQLSKKINSRHTYTMITEYVDTIRELEILENEMDDNKFKYY